MVDVFYRSACANTIFRIGHTMCSIVLRSDFPVDYSVIITRFDGKLNGQLSRPFESFQLTNEDHQSEWSEFEIFIALQNKTNLIERLLFLLFLLRAQIVSAICWVQWWRTSARIERKHIDATYFFYAVIEKREHVLDRKADWTIEWHTLHSNRCQQFAICHTGPHYLGQNPCAYSIIRTRAIAIRFEHSRNGVCLRLIFVRGLSRCRLSCCCLCSNSV